MGFFKAYDMRGEFGTDFGLDTVREAGRALVDVVGGRRWLVGRDCRTTGEAVRDALVAGLSAAGAEVTDIGLCTTPMVYFFTAEDAFDGSVMVTASHNPPSDNGLKVSRRTALPVGYADGLNEVEKRVAAALASGGTVATTSSARAAAAPADALERYVAWQKAHAFRPLAPLKYAVDCSNGMAGILARELFPGALLLNDKPDGRFPCHSPNPLKAESREQVARAVRENGLDCGVIFDGDADRAMFVDECGEFVQPDYLVPVVARATLKSAYAARPAGAPKIIHDVRTSRGAVEALRAMGCEPVMVPVGHAFAKPILRRIGGVCGGELAGHYYFSEFFGCDSGVLAALRILGEIAEAKSAGRLFSEMMAPISGRYANSGELNFKVADKDEAIRRALAVAAERLPRELSRSTMDGIRIEYAEGWINIRKSNTEPYLRLIVECDGSSRLADWTGLLSAAIESAG